MTYSKELVSILIDTLLFVPKDLVLLIKEYCVFFEGFFVCKSKDETIKEKFDDPYGIVNYGKNMYVCDLNNHRIQIRNTEGKFISSFGRLGTHNGEFNSPTNLFVRNSRLYISDYGNKRIQVFSLPKIDFLYTFECSDHCFGIAIYKSKIYVSVCHQTCIHVYTLKGKFIGNFGHSEKINSRENICIGNDLVYVSDYSNHRIVIFTVDGIYVAHWLGDKDNKIKFSFPRCLSIINGFIFVGDSYGLCQLDKEGKLIKQYACNRRCHWLTGICYFDNKFIISDNFDDRLIVLE